VERTSNGDGGSQEGQRPLVAIVVVYRQKVAAARAVASLLDGTRQPQRLLVVDHSPESDGELQLPVAPGLQLLRNAANPGFSAGVNLAAQLAPPGADFLLLNPDATLGRGTIEHLDRFMASRPRVAAAAPVIDFDPPRPRPWFEGGRVRAWLGDLRHAPARADGECEFVTGAAMWIRREAWDEVGTFDEGYFLYCEDVDWCWRARHAGWRVAVAVSDDPQQRARHLVSASIETHDEGDALKTYHIARGTLRVLVRHAGWLPLICFGYLRLLLIGLRVPNRAAWFRGILGRSFASAETRS